MGDVFEDIPQFASRVWKYFNGGRFCVGVCIPVFHHFFQ